MVGQRAWTGRRSHPKSCAEMDSSRQNKTWKTKMTWHRTGADKVAKMNLTGGEAEKCLPRIENDGGSLLQLYLPLGTKE